MVASLSAQDVILDSFYDDASQSSKDAINASLLLQSKGQWSKAWSLLAAFDPDNKDGYVLAEKIHIAMEGNIANGMYISFGFVDLADGQTLNDVRENPPEKQTVADFNPLDLVNALEKSGEAMPPVLSYQLGNYLYEVNREYGDNWIQDSHTIQTIAIENYDRALSYNTYNENSLSNHAELLTNLQEYPAAEAVLSKAIAAYPNNDNFSLKLATALNYQGKFDQVYPIVDPIITREDTSDTTYNAFIEGIKAGLNASDPQKTNEYVEAMIARFPDEYVPMLLQHLIEVNTGSAEKANAVADAVTAKFNVDPNVVRSLLSTWLNVEDSKSGFDYLNRSFQKYSDDDMAMGTLAFYRALMYAQTAQSGDELQLALNDIAEAERRFGTVYEKDNQVFEIINQLRDEWSQMLSQLTPEASAAPSNQTEQPAQTTEPESVPEADSPAEATSGATSD